jgi:hypothetical protein
VSLALVQTRSTLAVREAEIARLKMSASMAPAAAPVAAPPPSTAPARDSNVAVQALIAMTAERDQYKDGLDRCVEEVNRVAHGSGRRFEVPALPAAVAPAPAAPSTAAQAHISALYSEPTVTPLGDRMMVSGKLFNTGKAPGTVTAVVALLRDGKQVKSTRLRVTVPAQGQSAWSTQFPWGSQQGSWTATVSVE